MHISPAIDHQGLSGDEIALIAGKEYVYKIDVYSGSARSHIRFLTATTNRGWSAIYSFGQIEENRWYHIVATYDGALKRIYINGILDANTMDTSGAISTNSRKVSIGAYDGSWKAHFKGKIDEVIIFDRALTTEEVRSIMQNTMQNTKMIKDCMIR